MSPGSHRPHRCNDCGAQIDSGARCAACQAKKDAEAEEERRRREQEGR